MTLLVLPLLAGAAHAATVTEFPTAMRGDLGIAYQGAMARYPLVEDTDQVGSSSTADHQLFFAGQFSPLTGVAVMLALPEHLAETVTFADAHQMIYDPNLDAATMDGSPALDAEPTLSGAGLGGLWVGLRGAPFHQALYASRGDRSSWVLDIAYRFKDKSNFWTYNGRGNRGAGDGASAFRFRSAFSTTYRDFAQPWMLVTLERTGHLTTDAYAADGTVEAKNIQVQPASTAEIATGVEWLAGTYGAEGGRVDLGIHGRFGYTSWSDIPSGFYLPSVLDESRANVVTQSDRVYVRGGVDLHWRLVEYVQLDLGGEAGSFTPYQIEHLYDVRAGPGAISWQVDSGLTFHIDDTFVSRIGMQ